MWRVHGHCCLVDGAILRHTECVSLLLAPSVRNISLQRVTTVMHPTTKLHRVQQQCPSLAVFFQLAASLQFWNSPDGEHKPPCFFGTRRHVFRVPVTTVSQDASVIVFMVQYYTSDYSDLFHIRLFWHFLQSLSVRPFHGWSGPRQLPLSPSQLEACDHNWSHSVVAAVLKGNLSVVKTFVSLCDSSQSSSWGRGEAIVLFITELCFSSSSSALCA